jgi:hypothetical protein
MPRVVAALPPIVAVLLPRVAADQSVVATAPRHVAVFPCWARHAMCCGSPCPVLRLPTPLLRKSDLLSLLSRSVLWFPSQCCTTPSLLLRPSIPVLRPSLHMLRPSLPVLWHSLASVRPCLPFVATLPPNVAAMSSQWCGTPFPVLWRSQFLETPRFCGAAFTHIPAALIPN